MLSQKTLTHLRYLEAESIHIIREVAAEFERPVMLYSIGKDSTVMAHLAFKAFAPGKVPFPFLHVDTTFKFREMYDFRAEFAKKNEVELIVHKNPEGVKNNINPFDHGSSKYTDIMKTQGLKQSLNIGKYDAAFGGARREEEKSRAKERIYSFRDSFHQWDPKINVQNYGLYTMESSMKENRFVFFHSPTGQSLIFGNISIWKIFLWYHFILPNQDQ